MDKIKNLLSMGQYNMGHKGFSDTGCLGAWFLELDSLTGAAPLSISLNFPQLSVLPYEMNLVVVVLVMP